MESKGNFVLMDNEPAHYCPGCDMLHCIWVNHPCPGTDAKWQWNGDFDKPTFNPSVRVRLGDNRTCHYFIRNGNIEYLSDCTHKYAGQTIPIPELPEWARE